MSGRFNPFQSKQQEVLRPHTAADPNKARKLLAKFQRKRPCLWAEIPGFDDPAAVQTLDELDGATSVVVFLNRVSPPPLTEPLPPVLDALITRLWKNFNKLYLIRLGDAEQDGAAEDEGA